MFGFSITKVLFTIAVVVVVWQGFKWLQRRQAVESQRARDDLAGESARADDGIEEMVACPECGAYVAKGSGHGCAKPGCPFSN